MSESVVLRRPFESATGIPCAMVLTAYTSVGGSGPRAFVVREDVFVGAKAR